MTESGTSTGSVTEPGTVTGTGDRAWYQFRYRIVLVVPVPVRNSVPVGGRVLLAIYL